MLSTQPLKETYDLSDIANVALGGKPIKDAQGNEKKKYTDISNGVQAFYKLDHKEVLPQNQKPTSNFLALKKLHNLLYSRPREASIGDLLNDQKRELLFDILVAQLKNLCCKPPTNKIHSKKTQPNTDIKSDGDKTQKTDPKNLNYKSSEFLFLILNEEVKSKDTDDIILVNPESLEKNSSVLLLGPLTAPLTDEQLKIVVSIIYVFLMTLFFKSGNIMN